MSIFGDEVDDLLNDNIATGLEEDNEQLFGDEVQGDEAAEVGASGVPVKVQPKRRTINPRPRLTVETLRGPRGLHTIEEYFKDIKFKGKGCEKEDLDEVLKRLQHWGHRMYPTYKFDDVLANIERLGKKKELQVHMSRYRLNMLDSMKIHGDEVNAADDDDIPAAANEPFDEFDALLDEQIAISKIIPKTPGAGSAYKYGAGYNANTPNTTSSYGTPSFSKANAAMSTPYSGVHSQKDNDLATPLQPSQPATPSPQKQLTAEQTARILENRRQALERLAAKKLAKQQTQVTEINQNV